MHSIFFPSLLMLILFLAGAQDEDLPEWAISYGTETSYSSQTHLSGFGMSTVEGSREEALEDAKAQASSDLIRKVRVSVQSSVSSELRETEQSLSSSFTSISQTISNLELEGIDFEVADDKNTFYALAYIDRRSATEYYRNIAMETLVRIQSLRDQASDLEEAGKNSEMLERYVQLSPLFKSYYEQFSLTNTLKSNMSKAFEELDSEFDNSDSLTNPLEVVAWEQQAQQKISVLLNEESLSLDDAIRILVKQLDMQGLSVSTNKVLDLRYQDSDFSSAFGSYIARALAREMATGLTGESKPTITRGYYWDLGEDLELSIMVLAEDGRELAGARARVPKTGIPGNLEIKPRNFEQALKEKNALSDETFVDGGINVEVMSDKGGNDESTVLESGEEVNFYFRVNQPANLQLTYILADGTKVMLWDSFYIGIDRVNKVVKFPYTFVAAPPLGVERLIVTAYSEEPPEQNIIVQSIEGESYDVIVDEVSEMLAKTRGLKMKSENKMRVGVADLAITTIPVQ